MGFNEFIGKLFGNKATRDMKEIKPWVDKIKAVYPEIAKLSNDELRAKTVELKKYISDSAAEEQKKIEELKGTIETTELEDREGIFAQIDKLEKEVLEKYEKALDDVLPQAFAIVKDTARRFSENPELVVTATDFDRELAAQGKDFVRIEGDKAIWQNHWIAGGNDMVWSMVHYDVQLFGGVVLHKGKIAEMATGEGKTLVATLPVFLNALTGNGVHVVTVNDYLSKRDSEWMGPLYQFHGLSVDCIDKHQPNSDARRRAYMADITFGTNNEFGFDYLRDNMAVSPKDLVQRKHNYAIVDEVDSVLIDDARTPLIISGPVPKGEDQLFEQLRPLVERLFEAQKKLATQYLADAKRLIASDDKKDQEEGFLALFRSHKALPKNKPLIKFLSEQGIKAGMLKTEEIYMEQNNKRMPEATDPLYFVIDEKQNSVDLTDKGIDLITGNAAERQEMIQNEEDRDIWITSYDLLKRDIACYENIRFANQVIDEAQYIKNHGTQAAKSVRLIQSGFRMALTGTPMENRLSELWSIFDFLMPGFLYGYQGFREKFEEAIMNDRDEEVSARLRSMVHPFILRRLKKDVLTELPDKIEKTVTIELEGEQRKLYDAYAKRLKLYLEKQSKEEFKQSKLEVLKELTRLRQLCCGPELFLENYHGENAKMDACVELVRQAVDGGHKVLLFSQFTSVLDEIEKALAKEKIEDHRIDGSVSKEQRIRLVDSFETDDVPVFCISLKAGGTGLNLTAADIVIHYDPWWNVAAQNQATDRAHRIGQRNTVTVYDLIAENTIEEQIKKLQESKSALAEEILSGEGIQSIVLDRDEILKML